MTRVDAANPILWMVGTCVASSLAIVGAIGVSFAPEIVLGLVGPLVSAVVSWRIIERVHASAPERLTSVLITAFGIKAVLFGAYVAVVLGVLEFRATPFMLSFTGYYVSLHAFEAALLRRLLAAGVAGLPGASRVS